MYIISPQSLRIKFLQQQLLESSLNSALIVGEVNRFYLSGFISSNAMLLVSPKSLICFTDGRYLGRAKKDLGLTWQIIEIDKNFSQKLLVELNKQKIKTLGIEYDFYTLRKFNNLKKICKQIKFTDVSPLISTARQVKDLSEIKEITKATQLTDLAFTYIFKFIKKNYNKGLKEKTIAWEIEKFFRENGAEALSFEPIAASGPNSAIPHHISGERLIKKGDNIILDFGCKIDGYCSDMTRTIFIGQPNKQQTEIYNLVLQAQQSALDKVAIGVKSREIDLVARITIDNSKYKNKFVHGCGHGVGLEIHENPSLSQIGSETILQKNMIITVEPGIYIENKIGVRIEDLVLVGDRGGERLSRSLKGIGEMVIK